MLQRHVLICSGKMNPVKMHSAETNNNSKVIDITQLKMPPRPTLVQKTLQKMVWVKRVTIRGIDV